MPKKPSLPAEGIVPKLSVSAKLPKKTEAIVIPVFQGEDGPEIAATGVLGSKGEVAVLEALTTLGATGAAQEVTKLAGIAGSEVPVIIAVGLGDSEDFDAETLRRSAGVSARALKGFGKVASTLGIFGLHDAIVGAALGAYTYRGQKTAKLDGAKAPVKEIVFVSDKKDELESAQILVDSVVLARNLVNTASSHLYPEVYADFIASLAEEFGIEAEILDEKALAKGKFGGLLAVGGGSARKPRLLRLSYQSKKSAPSVALVGKGITFDTGGISLKPGAKMDDMISDMGGSAAAIAATIAAARLGLKVNVTATIPMAENMPDGESYRPGDVITHYGGKTSEILNTDAEGRLVLADAIVRASEDKPDFLIEMATLTGAQLVALGGRTSGVMGSDDFRDHVAEVGRTVGEPAWAMPFIEELKEEMTSDVADLRNIGKTRFGGMMQAGYYLSQFVGEDIQWVHMDIAGPAYNTAGAYGYVSKRGTGAPVRTVVAVLESLAEGQFPAQD
ncbi:Cytosol aminopeptidase [Corynebacterium kalinowskii]|uniref:Probable cytosol aminopeptidase n=1 Tax=Corynebacterium kalinowskii TaxID=2675216 RepID=A0A6B8VWM7_9CORY|nr:leucyl aminopeptidase [Corynebacterium kalinowskii]QGU01680.1 Cytosol aminopeptidase [Corynebacterium kalinowskii]